MNKKFYSLVVLLAILLCGVAGWAASKLTTGTMLALQQAGSQSAQGPLRSRAVSGGRLAAFVSYEGQATLDSMRQLGVQLGTVTDSIVTAQIPLDAVQEVAALTGVHIIQAARTVYAQLDSSRITTGAVQVQGGAAPLKQPFLGKGVLVGDIDAGLDFTHPDFRTAGRGDLRLRSVWLQSDTSGTPPPAFGYGTELSDSTSILKKGTDLAYYSHSTHVLGIAAGADTTDGNPYYGIAPQADLLFANFKDIDVGITDALHWMFNYADSAHMPVVINMSLGTQMGPHDGSSLSDRMCDAMAGSGHIIVGAAGNDGGVEAHVSKTFTAEPDTLCTGMAFLTTLGTPGSGELQVWGTPGKKFKVSVCTIDKATRMPVYQSRFYDATRTYTGTVTLQKPYDQSGGYFNIATQVSPLNGKPTAHIELAITDYQPDKVIAIMVTGEEGSTVHAWANPSYCIFRNHLQGMDVPDKHYLCSEIGGVGKSIITVGAYTSKMDQLNQDGDTIHATAYRTADITPYSNCGPTADGRMKPDVAAPGSVIVSALSSYESNNKGYVTKFQFRGRDYGYGTMEGTSMAAPHVAGIIATWLEALPKLTPDQIREAISHTAIHDSYTGTEPNNTFGYGKIDAYAGLVYCLKNFAGINDVKAASEPWRGVMRPDGLHLLFLQSTGKATISVFTPSGALVQQSQVGPRVVGDEHVVNLSGLSRGLYLVTVDSGSKHQAFKCATP